MGGNPNSVFWISFVFTGFMQTASLFILRNLVHFSLRRYVREVLLPFVLVVSTSFIIPLIPYYFMQYGWWRFIFVLFISVATSSISVYFLGLNKKEKDLINSIISKFIKIKKIFS